MEKNLRLYKVYDSYDTDKWVIGVVARSRSKAKYIGRNELDIEERISIGCRLHKEWHNYIEFDKPRVISELEWLRSWLYDHVYNWECKVCGTCKSYEYYLWDKNEMLCEDCYNKWDDLYK